MRSEEEIRKKIEGWEKTLEAEIEAKYYGLAAETKGLIKALKWVLKEEEGR